MSNLQTHIASLEALITKANALPTEKKIQETKTVTPSTSSQTVQPDSGYDGLGKVTVNAMPTGTLATPTIEVDANGKITAKVNQSSDGYIASGSKSATKQLAFQAAKTITPSAASQIAVSSGYYTGGNITVAGDSNLVAGNIKKGTSIFGITGNYEGSGGNGDTSMEDALITRSITNYANNRVESIGRYAFTYCTSLTTASFPACTTIGNYAFRSCTSLTTVSFPVCKTIGNYAFSGCSSLTKIYLTGSSVCSLPNTTVFMGTGINAVAGSIYVPASLVATYKVTTNWAYYSSRIFGV